MPIGLVARLYVRLSSGASFRKLLGDALMFGVPKDWHWIVHRSRRDSGSILRALPSWPTRFPTDAPASVRFRARVDWFTPISAAIARSTSPGSRRWPLRRACPPSSGRVGSRSAAFGNVGTDVGRDRSLGNYSLAKSVA